MLTKINVGSFDIYTNQIVHPKEFEGLYKKEKILTTFKTRVNYSSGTQIKPFFTFLANNRSQTQIKEEDYVIFRAIKTKNKFEFISKIGKWGKVHLLKKIIQVLDIKNHDNIDFEVIQPTHINNNLLSNFIDLSEIKGNTKFILREDNLITLIKKATTPITLPRFIEITSELIELCFLIHGDGHYKTKLFFVNKEAGLHKFVLNKFEEILRIPKELWRARLLFNNNTNPEIAKNKWKSNLNLKAEQFYPNISRCVLQTSTNGNLRIVIDKLIVSEIFRFIFNNIKEPKGKDAIHALNGLLCAEGSPEIGCNGLHKITLNLNQDEKLMFSKILSEAGLISLAKDRKDRFVFEGWHNHCAFFKIFLLNKVIPFNTHRDRCKKALSGFLNHEFTQTMENYLTLLAKKESMDTNELIKETNYLGNSVRKILRNKKYVRFVNVRGKGVNRNPLMFSITPEGKDFLKLIKDIKEVYDEKCKLKQD